MLKFKKNKKGVEIIEVVIALAILGLTAVTVTGALSKAMKHNGQTVIEATDLKKQPTNTTP